MKHRFALVLFLMTLVLAVSCSTTNRMTNEIAIDSNLTLEEKLDTLGYESVSITYPTIIYDGEEWKEQLIQMLKDTKDYFICTVFLGSECDENQEIFDVMRSKAQEGVDIYIVTDGTSSLDMTDSKYHLRTLYSLREYGVHLLEYNPLTVKKLAWGFNLFFREHRKYFVSDGLHVAIGGMNLNYISTSSVENGGDRDSMYIFDSYSCAKALTEAFTNFWNRYSWETIEEGSLTAPYEGVEEVGTIKAWIEDQVNGGEIAPLYGSLLAEAKEEVLILPFLPTLNSDMFKALKNCTSRGVKVEMILRNEDRKSLLNAAKYATKDLIDAGVEVRHEDLDKYTNGSLLHEKLVIIDERYIICGSSNFNFRSMAISSEVTLVIDCPELAKQVKEHYLEIRDYTEEITYEEAEQWHSLSNKLNFLLNLFGG